jgi:hypothetical protein
VLPLDEYVWYLNPDKRYITRTRTGYHKDTYEYIVMVDLAAMNLGVALPDTRPRKIFGCKYMKGRTEKA